MHLRIANAHKQLLQHNNISTQSKCAFILLCLCIHKTCCLSPLDLYNHSTEHSRHTYNKQQLITFKQALDAGKCAVIISDLHNVVLDRIPGDITRASHLKFGEFARFITDLALFGTRYLLYSTTNYITRPDIEEYLLHNVHDQAHRERVLSVICPFRINETMYHLYKHVIKLPIFACSNCGQQSYAWMNKRTNNRLNELFLDVQLSSSDNNYALKNTSRPFLLLLEKMATHGIKPDVILMIDDKKHNIHTCTRAYREHNITVCGYIFQNAHELENDLHSYAITEYTPKPT
jgi:hypothetical protein